MDLSQRRELTQGATHRSSGSFEMVLAGTLLALVGLALDGALGMFPVLFCVFAVLGFFGSATGLYYRYRTEMDRHAATRLAADRARRPAAS